MNLFALNSNAINGTSVSIIAVSANLLASTAATVVATRVQTTNVVLTGTATLVALQTHTLAAAADVLSLASLQAMGSAQLSASAQASCSAGFIASVLRMVPAEASLLCRAEFSAIPASQLGAANLAARSVFSARATHVKPGAVSALMSVQTTASALATRQVAAQLVTQAQLRSEAQQNKAVDGFADLAPSIQIGVPDVGIIRALAYADVTASVIGLVQGTQERQGSVDAACLAEVVADSNVFAIVGSFLRSGLATIIADPIRVVLPAVTATATVSTSAAMLQNHVGNAQVTGTANTSATGLLLIGGVSVSVSAATKTIVADATVIKNVEADITVAAATSAVAILRYFVSADLRAAAQTNASGTVLRMASAGLSCVGLASVNGLLTQYGAALVSGKANLSTTALAARMVAATVSGRAAVSPFAVALLPGRAAMASSAALVADSRTNAEALDPPERTLMRPFTDRVMYRPYTERTLRRAA